MAQLRATLIALLSVAAGYYALRYGAGYAGAWYALTALLMALVAAAEWTRAWHVEQGERGTK